MNNKYTLQDIAALVSVRSGKGKEEVETFLKELFALVSDKVISDGIVRVKGIGTFKSVFVEARESINVNTNERFTIPAHKKFSFVPDKELAEQVNKPFSFFETTEISDKVTDEELGITDITTDELTEVPDDEESAEDIPVVLPEPVTTQSEPEEPKAEITEQEEPKSVSELEVVEEKSIEPETSETETESEEETKGEQEPGTITEEKNTKGGDRLSLSSKVMIACVAALCILTVVNLYVFFNPQSTTMSDDESVVSVQKVETVVVRDTILKDSIVNKETLPQQNTTDNVSSEKTFPMKYKIEAGSRLSMLAKQYYGNKVFWVYIYEHNKGSIADPNNVPIGTEIELPRPDTYGINSADTASVEAAKRKQTEIINRLSKAK
jgi:nucleoid DNA-binding protein